MDLGPTEDIVAVEGYLGRFGGPGWHLDDESVTSAAAAAMERPLETHDGVSMD